MKTFYLFYIKVSQPNVYPNLPLIFSGGLVKLSLNSLVKYVTASHL